jgi:hypothetical protein
MCLVGGSALFQGAPVCVCPRYGTSYGSESPLDGWVTTKCKSRARVSMTSRNPGMNL